MKIIYNNIIPFKGYFAINIFGLLFVRKDVLTSNQVTDRVIHHETIHMKQMIEMGFVFFYIWYFIEWLIKLFYYKFNNYNAYKAISFEREAYTNESDYSYLYHRKHYSWLNYIRRA